MKTALSFIIPVYNGSEFIVRCLDSICNLDISVQEYEVIVIDDCSTDNTRDVVRGYMTSHPQVHLLCQPENHRQGAARNKGVAAAKGRYVAFVDADDIVLSGMVSAYLTAQKTDADMVYTYMEIEQSNGNLLHQLSNVSTEIMSGVQFGETYCTEGVSYYPLSYLYKKTFLEKTGIRFIEDRQHEDRDWLAAVLVQAASVAVCPQVAYRYTCNPNSTCRAPRYSTVFDHVASGIRHIRLSEDLASTCPNLSKTLYAFGYDEIYKSLRFRNLTKYGWTDNKHLYDELHLKPLLADVKHLLPTLPKEIRLVVNIPVLTSVFLYIASPITKVIRQFKQKARKFIPFK